MCRGLMMRRCPITILVRVLILVLVIRLLFEESPLMMVVVRVGRWLVLPVVCCVDDGVYWLGVFAMIGLVVPWGWVVALVVLGEGLYGSFGFRCFDWTGGVGWVRGGVGRC